MKTLVIAAVVAFTSATQVMAQETSPTKALVHMIVTEQFCKIDAPQSLVLAVGERAEVETGLTVEQLLDASYGAANIIGQEYTNDGSIVGFCLRMAQIYGEVR